MDRKIILLDHQNNFIGISSMISNAKKNVDILAISLNILHNFNDSTKLCLDLFLIKFLDSSAKSFFPYNILFVYEAIWTLKFNIFIIIQAI